MAWSVPLDTTEEAQALQDEIYRRLGGRERMAVTLRLSATVRAVAMAGIRQRHPDYDDAQVRRALARLLCGDALVRQFWPEADLVEP